MADPGRLRDLLTPGVELRVVPARDPGRSTRWTAVLVRAGTGEWVSLDTTLPNRLIHRALEKDALEEFRPWRLTRTEWRRGRSRLDFLLEAAEPVSTPSGTATRLALEVKSVTLVEGGEAWFPDAVTARGERHLRELSELASTPGWAAAVLFVLQRPHARVIRPAAHVDPRFATRLTEAAGAGVRVLGRRCRIDAETVVLGGPIDVMA